MPLKSLVLFSFSALLAVASSATWADQMCGDTGVWVQILGAGGPELDDGQGGSSYLIWNDNKPRVLIDTGPGSSVAFEKAEANIEDLYAIAYTHLHADHAVDFPAFIKGSSFAQRTKSLIILGPDSTNKKYPDTVSFVDRMIGPTGAFSYLQGFLSSNKAGGYRVRARNVPAAGNRPWAQFGNEELKLSAIPVNHGDVPALAWRVDIGGKSVVFTGDFNNLKNVVAKFSKNTDALVVTHALAENSRGTLRDLHVLPSQIGRIAKQAQTRMVVLGHRMNRTRGRESQSRSQIEKHYDGYILFANDMECWGL
ncbi:MAG: MBL fold metallo-hydrolase [Gammaproteobacteria bacterium]|nr:MBL fold metallo-hydrolase [Gammaproteobacteria bacterium]